MARRTAPQGSRFVEALKSPAKALARPRQRPQRRWSAWPHQRHEGGARQAPAVCARARPTTCEVRRHGPRHPSAAKNAYARPGGGPGGSGGQLDHRRNAKRRASEGSARERTWAPLPPRRAVREAAVTAVAHPPTGKAGRKPSQRSTSSPAGDGPPRDRSATPRAFPFARARTA